jgi:hypothetical protein
MAAPERIEVRASANFLANLEGLAEFLLRVDPDTAPQRYRRLMDQWWTCWKATRASGERLAT